MTPAGNGQHIRAGSSQPGRSPSRAQPGAGNGKESGAASGHIRRLREQGSTYRAIATAAGLGPTTVHAIAAGRRAATPGTATALLSITEESITGARIDADGTRLRLRALHVMGHSSARIARAAGASDKTIRKLTRGDAATVSLRLRNAVIAVYDSWWDKRAPERTRVERTAAATARRRAIAGNWCAGAALDDDELDIPGYRPEHGWKPARGTGTATSYHPRARGGPEAASRRPAKDKEIGA